MPGPTEISWTDVSWNPVRGCARVSPGCENCYAERQAHRFSGPGKPYEGLTKLTAHGPRWTGKVRLVPELLDWPLRRKKGLRIFVNSMSDLFHEGLSFEEITAVYAIMQAAPQHVFQVLTKRPERRLEWAKWIEERGGLCPFIRSMTVARKDEPEVARVRQPFNAICRTEVVRGKTCRSMDDPWMRVFSGAAVWQKGPLFNVWEGVSVENQKTADERIPLLLDTPAAVRWVSAEPLLESVNIAPWLRCMMPKSGFIDPKAYTNSHPTEKLNWVVVGGESGPSARACDVAWIRSLRDQCQAAGVATFVKQDSGPKSGMQGRIPDDLWVKEFPK